MSIISDDAFARYEAEYERVLLMEKAYEMWGSEHERAARRSAIGMAVAEVLLHQSESTESTSGAGQASLMLEAGANERAIASAERMRAREPTGSPSAELGRSEPTSRVDAMLKRQEAQRRDSKVADFVELRRMHEQETVLLLYALERENNEHLRQRAAGNAARPHSDGKRTVSQPSTQQSAITERSK